MDALPPNPNSNKPLPHSKSSDGLTETQIQAHKLTTLGAMAAGMAHDVNNLMTGGMTFTTLLQQRLIDQQQLNYVHLIHKSFEKAGLLAQGVLRSIREETETPYPMNPLTCVRDVTQMVQRTLPHAIELTLSLPTKSHAVSIRNGDLSQILLNLLINARDSIGDFGEIRVSGSYDTSSSPRSFTLSVWDNGPGIDAHIADRIFDPFFTTKSPDKGTGLGLAIVKQLTEQAGGTISVDSLPNHHCCFKITLPVVSVHG